MFINISKDEIEELCKLANTIVNSSIKNSITIATAESCTGGLISAIITSIPGSSKIFLGSVVAYSNELKTSILGVEHETLINHGAVSSQVALEMVRGLKFTTMADHNVAVTGIAGPSGGTVEKPVGLVYISFNGPDNLEFVKKFNFHGDRERIRFETVKEALKVIYNNPV